MTGRRMVRVRLFRTVLNERVDEQFIYLREEGEGRVLPICIGMFEAAALDRVLRGRETSRPLTHDLLLSVVDGLGGEMERLEIVDQRDETFFARLVVEGAGGPVRLDARPSDGITLAVKRDVPIYCAREVLEAAGREA